MFGNARLLNLLVCAVFGLLGGAVSHLLFAAGGVSAQQTSDSIRTNVIRAKRFELVDEGGKVLAVFGRGLSEPAAGAELVFGDARNGVSLSVNGLRVNDRGKVRVAVGMYGIKDPGGKYDLAHLLLVQDENGNPLHILK